MLSKEPRVPYEPPNKVPPNKELPNNESRFLHIFHSKDIYSLQSSSKIYYLHLHLILFGATFRIFFLSVLL
jgi:hypothetical protein